jgi:hypothetical protein
LIEAESRVRSSSCSGTANRQTAGRARRALAVSRALRELGLRALTANDSNHEVKRIVNLSGAVLTLARHSPLASPR